MKQIVFMMRTSRRDTYESLNVDGESRPASDEPQEVDELGGRQSRVGTERNNREYHVPVEIGLCRSHIYFLTPGRTVHQSRFVSVQHVTHPASLLCEECPSACQLSPVFSISSSGVP